MIALPLCTQNSWLHPYVGPIRDALQRTCPVLNSIFFYIGDTAVAVIADALKTALRWRCSNSNSHLRKEIPWS